MNKGVAIRGKRKKQIAFEIFNAANIAMKDLLDAAEWKHNCNRESSGFKWYKKHVMDRFYPMLVQIYKHLEAANLIVPCGCGDSVVTRNGYTGCEQCHGCGYKNSPDLNDFLADFEN